jgi:hypothetical protein
LKQAYFSCFLKFYFYFIYYFKGSDYEIFRLTSDKLFDNQIWSSFNIGRISQKKLNEKYPLEYSNLKEYSGYLISKNFANIQTNLKHIEKTRYGYYIYRSNFKNKWILKINISDNEIIIKKSI